MEERDTVLVVENARKRFSSSSFNFELLVPHFEAKRGEFIAVVGASGCGKSTFLDLIGLIRRPDHCERLAIVDGSGSLLELDQASERQRASVRRESIGYLLQDGGLLSCLSGRRNIELTRALSGKPSGLGEFERVVERLGLATHLDYKPALLSGGQRQRMALVRAMASRPALLLADEPTGAVDELTAVEIVEELRALATAMETAVVMVTHHASLVAGIANRCVGFDIDRQGGDKGLTVSICKDLQPSLDPR